MKTFLLTIFFFSLGFNSLISNSNNKITFIENKGQWDSRILYSAQQNGIITNIIDNGIMFDFYKIEGKRIKGDVLKMDFVNSNNFNIIPLKQTSNNHNFFFGNDERKWIKNARSYEKIKIADLYDGINLEVILTNQSPRYDFIIEPFADPEQIKFTFEGMSSLNIENDNLIVTTFNTIIENKNLFAYQEVDGTKQRIKCKFILKNNNIQFDIGEYDQSKELVIDPVVYSSYYGGSGVERANVIEFIDDETLIMAGVTSSNDLRTTTGAYDEEYGDRNDGFLTKFKIENSEYIPQFTTYLGSLEYDEIVDIELNSNFILVLGNTESPDFPLAKPFRNQFSGGSDIFITSFGLNGDTILQSSFYGGTGDDIAVEVSEDRSDGYIIAASTNSSNLQVVGGPPNSGYKGDIDILIFRLNSDRTAVTVSAYIGGVRDDVPTDMYLDPFSDNILLTGYTTSSKGGDQDFPVFPEKRFGRGGPYDETSNGRKDAFVMQLTSKAQTILISSFLGGDGDDIGRGIWLNSGNEIYVIGETYNNNDPNVGFPVTSGDNVVKGNSDIFISKFNELSEQFGIKTQTMNFSNLIESMGNDTIGGFARMPNNLGFGVALSTNNIFPEISSTDLKPRRNIIYTELDDVGGEVIQSMLFGGINDEYATHLTYDNYDNFMIAGYTNSNDFELTKNASDVTLDGESDIILIRNNSFGMTLFSPSNNEILCVGSEVSIQWSGNSLNAEDGYDIAYMLNNDPNTFTTIVSDLNSESYIWTLPEELSGEDSVIIRISHSSGAFIQNDNYYSVNESAKINEFNMSTPDTLCIGEDIELNATSFGEGVEYVWFKDNVEIDRTNNGNLTISNVTTDDSGEYKVSVVNECPPQQFAENRFNVYVSPNTSVEDIANEITKNKGETLEITANATGVELSFDWYKDGNLVPSQEGPTLTLSNLSLNDAGKYKCVVTGKCGTDSTNTSNVIVEDVMGNIAFELTDIANIYRTNNSSIEVNILNYLNYELAVYDLNGLKLFELNNQTNLTTLDISEYNNGIYWIVVEAGDNKYKYKFTVVK
jgi:hypothetical protein